MIKPLPARRKKFACRNFILLLIAVFACLGYKADAQLRQIHYEATDQTKDINRVSFYSPNEGYVTFVRSIGFTTDSGHTFTVKPILTNAIDYNGYNNVNLTFGFDVVGMKAFDKNNLLVYGDFGLIPSILYSNDGGGTYKLVYYNDASGFPNAFVSDISFASDNKTGFAVDLNHIIKTTDGGKTWSQVSDQTGHHLTSIQALSATNVYTYGSNDSMSSIFTTTDGGANWGTANLPANSGFINAAWFSSSRWYLNTIDQVTYSTTNGGATYTKQNDRDMMPFQCGKMVFVNDSTGYATSTSGTNVYKTSNSGKIWELLHHSGSYVGYNLSIADIQVMGSQIWAGGGNGFLELSTNAGGPPVPSVYFAMDTTAVSSTGNVKLVNYSRTNYKYNWLRNGKSISTSYNTSYTADIYAPNDTIALAVTDGPYTDTLTQYTSFSRAPMVTSFSPDTGYTGTRIAIQGSNFSGVTGVSFGGVPAASYQVLSPYDISAVVGKGASGIVTVTTSKSHGGLHGFVYVPPPVITSFSPAAAAVGSTVTINGKNLSRIVAVTVGGAGVASVKQISATQIQVVLDKHTQSGNIIVTTVAGSDTLSGFHTIPQITSFTPTTGKFGTVVDIVGTSFYDVTAVTVDGYPVHSFRIIDGTDIEITMGLATSGVITVTAPGGSGSLGGFVYHAPPKINSFSPLTAVPGTSITITGANFNPVAANNLVYFGAEKATVTAATTTTLTVNAPVGATYDFISVSAYNNIGYSKIKYTPKFAATGSLTATSFGTPYNLFIPNNAPGGAFLADVDNNNLPEIIIPTIGSSNLLAVVNVDSSSSDKLKFSSQLLQTYIGGQTVEGATCGAATDYDMDGKLDLFLPGIYNDIASTQYCWGIHFSEQYGYNEIEAYTTLQSLNGGGSYYPSGQNVPKTIAINDMDGDGTADLVIGGFFNAQFPNAIVSDIDGDGRPDVLVRSNSSVAIYRNTSVQGTISYAAPVNFNNYDNTSTVAEIITGDFDGDGKNDIAFITNNSSSNSALSVMHNTSDTGSIAFAQSITMSVDQTTYHLTAADMDGDGKVDILVAAGGYVYIYKNISTKGAISFAPPIKIQQGAQVALVVGDINADGAPDIIGIPSNADHGFVINSLLGTSLLPQVTSFTPAGGQTGTSITINGTGFTGITKVQIGGKDVKSFTVNSSTSISAVVGNDTTGYVSVQTAAASAQSPKQFIYLIKPVINYYTPLTFNYGGSVDLLAHYGNANYSYQWYYNGAKIFNADQTYYTATTSGSYTLGVSFGGDTLMSDPVVVNAIYTLPQNNFKVTAYSATCRGSNNGSISIIASQSQGYTAVLTGGNIGSKSYTFNPNLNIPNLAAGSYNVCITVAGHPDYQQCFSLTITEPKDLAMFDVIDKTTNSLKLQLSGGDVYNIELNNKQYTTTDSAITLPLAGGTNRLAISTDKPCQGVLSKLINVSDIVSPYPNPFNDVVNINVGNTKVSKANITVTGVDGGRVLYTTEFANPYGVLQVDLSKLPHGAYLLNLTMDNKRNVFKITK